MRKRNSNPVILVAAFLALAIGAWWQHDGAAERRHLPETVPAAAEDTARRAEPPSAAPAATATLQTRGSARPTEPDRAGLETLVPNDTERVELEKTLELIRVGGPFPHRQDGSIFMNREGRLPDHPRGYYHEYTVRTPGARNRGARRVVRGDGGELYYTRDHYRTFIRLDD